MRNLINLFNEVFDNRFDKFNSIEDLMKQEQLAIKSEDHEKAAILRDKIKKMKNKD